MTDQFDYSIEFWERFTALIEYLDLKNSQIDWNDTDVKTHGINHLVERRELEGELKGIRDRYANTFEDVIHENDPDYNLKQIDQHVRNIEQTEKEIRLLNKKIESYISVCRGA